MYINNISRLHKNDRGKDFIPPCNPILYEPNANCNPGRSR
jgi:hypothetical protein